MEVWKYGSMGVGYKNHSYTPILSYSYTFLYFPQALL